MLNVGRFLSGFARDDRAPVGEREVDVQLGGGSVEATLMEPRSARAASRHGWVVLHGITVPGRRHPTLRRFARALAAAGGPVLIPEIPAWRDLIVDPLEADRVISAALHDQARRTGRRVGLIGFSFGATQALITAARDDRDLEAVVGFGGYCDLGSGIRYMVTGEHEWQGRRYRADPDPYGRWIVAGNFLTQAPGYGSAGAVAQAAHELAAEAGRVFVYAGDTSFDPLKERLRDRLDPGDRELWDIIAPPAGAPPHPGAAALAESLARAAVEARPELDPRPLLPRLRRRVVLAHGRDDLLIPFTETLRLAQHLPATAQPHIAITRLFAHSGEADPLRAREYPAELARYLRLLRAALR